MLKTSTMMRYCHDATAHRGVFNRLYGWKNLVLLPHCNENNHLPFQRSSTTAVHRSYSSSTLGEGIRRREIWRPLFNHIRKRRLSAKVIGNASPVDSIVSEKGSETKTIATKLGAEGKRARLDDDMSSTSRKEEENNEEEKEEDDEEEEYDERTFREKLRAALWVAPRPDDPIDRPETPPKPKMTPSRVFRALDLAWSDYKGTWEGFFNNVYQKEKGKEGDEYGGTTVEFQTEEIEKKGRELKDNTERNMGYLKEEGIRALEFAKESTGVQNKVDMKKWVGKQIKLASLCVNEFMKGYRQGRDDEMDKMLNEYFKDFDEKEEVKGTETSVKEQEDGEIKSTLIKGGRRRTNRKRRKR